MSFRTLAGVAFFIHSYLVIINYKHRSTFLLFFDRSTKPPMTVEEWGEFLLALLVTVS